MRFKKPLLSPNSLCIHSHTQLDRQTETRQAPFFVLKKIFSINSSDLIIAGLSILAFLIFVPVFTYAYFANDLVSTDAIMNKNDTGIVLYDRSGRPFFTFYQGQPKNYIPFASIPKYTQQAIIAMEDKDFYSHPGFSVPAIVRAMWEDILSRNLSYGGSTITQQLVKNSLLTSRKDFLRKYQEVVLASEIERRYSKNQILEMYLNSVYFGEGSFGVEEAAQTYFGTDAKNLDLAQSAFLAALLPAPSALSPFHGDLAAARDRQKYILGKMAEQGYITQKQADQAVAEPLIFHPPADPINSQAIHFALMVRDELVQKYGEEQVSRAGLHVKTTLDLGLQEFAQQVVAQQVARLAPDNVSNGAAVVIDPKTGEILAMVGSADWNNPKFGKVNVTLMPRQPGSSFKPIYYSAALDKDIITPATILTDTPTTFPGGYKPHDYDNQFWGSLTVRQALANSRNVPSVEVMNKLGVLNAVDQAHALGITTLQDPSQYGLALALGAGDVRLLDLTGAYAAFADQGMYNIPTSVLQIKDKNNNIIYSYQPTPSEAVSPQAAFLISSILSDNNARAREFGNLLTISRTAAVKTGTTENYRDSLTLGYTPSVTVGVWVGNNDGAPMDNVAGSLGAAPIWKAIMEHYLAGTPVEQFIPPPGIISATTCTSISQPTPTPPPGKEPPAANKQSLVSGENKTTVVRFSEYFIQGTQLRNLCPGTNSTPEGHSQNLPPVLTPLPLTTFYLPSPAPSPTAPPTPMISLPAPTPNP